MLSMRSTIKVPLEPVLMDATRPDTVGQCPPGKIYISIAIRTNPFADKVDFMTISLVSCFRHGDRLEDCDATIFLEKFVYLGEISVQEFLPHSFDHLNRHNL